MKLILGISIVMILFTTGCSQGGGGSGKGGSTGAGDKPECSLPISFATVEESVVSGYRLKTCGYIEEQGL